MKQGPARESSVRFFNPTLTALACLGLAALTAWSATTRYVWPDSPNPTPPYTDWTTAARVIQDAVDAARADDLVLVTNGTYATGGRADGGEYSRVAVVKAVTVRSLNGPTETVISGSGRVRCVFAGDGVVLSGFTLTKGSASYGAGARCAPSGVLTNCVVTRNQTTKDGAPGGAGVAGGILYDCTLSSNSVFAGCWEKCTPFGDCYLICMGGTGGGALGSTLYNCRLIGNSAETTGGGADNCTLYNCTLTGNNSSAGGGACASTLYNCTLTGNSAREEGGGANGGTLYNCIVYFNTAPGGANYSGAPTFVYSCTAPLPKGQSNLDADPRFVDTAGGDLRLRPDSPCIDAGTNLTESLTTDLLGLPRPLDGNGDGVAGFDMGAYEFNPYRFGPALRPAPDGFHLTIVGEPGKTVRIERSRDLVNWEVAFEVSIRAGGQSVTDPVATSEAMVFYRAVAQ